MFPLCGFASCNLFVINTLWGRNSYGGVVAVKYFGLIRIDCRIDNNNNNVHAKQKVIRWVSRRTNERGEYIYSQRLSFEIKWISFKFKDFPISRGIYGQIFKLKWNGMELAIHKQKSTQRQGQEEQSPVSTLKIHGPESIPSMVLPLFCISISIFIWNHWSSVVVLKI